MGGFIYYCFFPRFVAQPEIYEKRVLDFSQGEIDSPCLKPCLRTQVCTTLKLNAYNDNIMYAYCLIDEYAFAMTDNGVQS